MLSQALSVLLAIAALAGYLRRQRGLSTPWPRRLTTWFTLGLLLALAVSCGPISHYDRVRYWVWVSQSLALLLIVPLPLMAGRPVELVRATSRTADRWPSAPSWLRSPLLGPALMPLVCVVVLFGPVPGWAAGNVWVGWLVHL
ncbi:MAG TPA: cytochrome c oxidase assembly protein, partial [Jatrophihabitans sp.]|nr:cytochrome c oxidase assembly protein [Jatrophihabitans sp.]